MRHVGLAIYDQGQLKVAKHLLSPNAKDRGAKAWLDMARVVREFITPWGPDTLVIERMKVYPRSGNDPDDLLEVNGVVGAVSASWDFSKVVSPLPREWKGSVPKKIHNNRVYGKLTESEKVCIDTSKTYWDDTIDACGLGLWHLDR